MPHPIDSSAFSNSEFLMKNVSPGAQRLAKGCENARNSAGRRRSRSPVPAAQGLTAAEALLRSAVQHVAEMGHLNAAGPSRAKPRALLRAVQGAHMCTERTQSKTGDCDPKQRRTGAACRNPPKPHERSRTHFGSKRAPHRSRTPRTTLLDKPLPSPSFPSTRFCSSAPGRFHAATASAAARPFQAARC